MSKLFLSRKFEAQGRSSSHWSVYLACMKLWPQSLALCKSSMMAQAHHLNTWEIETNGSEVQGHLWLHCKFEASLEYMRLCSRKGILQNSIINPFKNISLSAVFKLFFSFVVRYTPFSLSLFVSISVYWDFHKRQSFHFQSSVIRYSQ